MRVNVYSLALGKAYAGKDIGKVIPDIVSEEENCVFGVVRAALSEAGEPEKLADQVGATSTPD